MEARGYPATPTMETGRPRCSQRTNGGLRVSRGAARREQWRRQEREGWVGGHFLASGLSGLQSGAKYLPGPNRSPPWDKLRNRSPLCAELGNGSPRVLLPDPNPRVPKYFRVSGRVSG